jgi:hypothetical protein
MFDMNETNRTTGIGAIGDAKIMLDELDAENHTYCHIVEVLEDC